MIVLANGCSWTYGGGLDTAKPSREELDQLTWPKHLSNLLGAEKFYNLADGCGSNQRIFRTTLNWILSQSKETLENTMAVIQWTEEARYEYYVPVNFEERYENIEEQWVKVKPGVVSPSRFVDLFDLSQNRLKYHNSEIQNVYTYISNCEAMANLLTRHGIKYYFWDFTDTPRNLPYPFNEYVINNFNWLQSPEKEQWNFWEYDRLPNDSHPSITGHQQIAQIIYNQVKQKL